MSSSIPGPFRRTFVSLLLTACMPALLCAPHANAQDTTTAKEHVKLIRAQRDMAVLGKDLFGDRVNLYTGSLEFVQTDVSLPGNSALPVSVGRRLVAGDNPIVGTLFGRWDLEIPRLHGIFSKSRGWVSGGDNSGARCSAFGEPPQVNGSYGSVSRWKGTEYWHGSFLYVPGAGDQEMLGRTASYTQAPGNQRSIYPIVTRNNWAIRCLTAMDPKNGGTGEAFVAVAPDGTEYRFDWIVSRPAPELSKASSGPETWRLPVTSADVAPEQVAKKGKPSPDPSVVEGNVLARQEVWILPTRITDRFGNTVSYTYDTTNKWQLTKIESNDATGSPRVITLTYETPGSLASNLVSSVNDGTRTWTYSYDTTIAENANLTGVTLPDQSRWDLAGVASLLFSVDYLGSGSCDTPSMLNPVQLNGYMTHPSGARGDFTLTPTYHGRSGVEEQCDYDVETETYSPYYPKVFSSNALTRKTLSGPGLPPMEWNTTYSAQASSWAPCNACSTTKQVLVTEPSGDKTLFTFGTLFRQTEGQLQQTDVIESNGSVIRSTRQRYAEPVTPFGVSYQRRGDGELASRVMETDRRIISQQGLEFTWLASQFNSFAKPTNVTRSSPLGSRAETTEYENNLSKWVLGQIKQVKENSTGKVMVLNEYDPATATLKKMTRFGKLEQTLAYYADGTLDTQMDGLNQSTKFSNYKRGQAQAVRYHNGSTEGAVVNNIGAIASATDAAGYTTAYDYDAMGRRKLITPPANTAAPWNPTTIVYSQVATEKYGLSAGHWSREVTTGTAHTATYYDALWREIYTERFDSNHVNESARITKRQYDAAGHITYESYPKRRYENISDGIYHEYDALGRPTVTGTNTESGLTYSGFSYGNDFQKTYTDARQFNTTYRYQAFDEPVENAVSNIIAPEGVNVAIGRDLFGKPQSVVRSGTGKSATRSYVYDANERLCKTIEPETGATVQNYDGANNLWWRASGLALPSLNSCDTDSVPAAKKIIYGYDTLNRLLTTTYADASPGIGRTYTPDGLPLTIGSGGTTWTYKYNERRLLETETLAYLGSNYELKRDYDENASLKQLTYPDNMTIAYGPNALGEPSHVGEYAKNVTYHPNGATASFSYGNGIIHTLDQNLRGLPERSLDGGVLNDLYAYDQNGNVTSILDWHEGVSNRAMEYDQLGRLTRTFAPGMWGDARYSYDALDNLTNTMIERGAKARTTVHTFDPATNRLKGITGPSGYNLVYDYDGQGNVKQRGAQQYVFDMGNRMKEATGRATYVYDGWGRRASVVGTDGLNRLYVYNQDGKLMYGGPTSASKRKYIYLGNHMIAEDGVAGLEYIHTDGLGSPLARTSRNGALISRTRYEPYGLTAMGEEPTIGFTGHVNDFATGLVYMPQRYYDPIAGRMLSIDPVVTDANTGGSFNRYAYVENNPYRYVDPDGRGLVDGLIKVLVKVVVAAVKTETKQVAKEAGKGAAKEAAKDGAKSAAKEGAKDAGATARGVGKNNEPKSTLPRDKQGNYKPDPNAAGPHTTLGQRTGQNGESYTQGATFDKSGKFEGRTDVTGHPPRSDHPDPHFHPATGPNTVGPAEPIP